MLILITGVPGSGKSLYATTLVQKYLKEGRTVFTDIEGLNIPGVGQSIPDWRDLPDGSVVFYDEAQMHMGTALPRNLPDHITDLTIHRHRGFDIVLITQGPKLINSFIRPLIGRHHHLERIFGSNSAKLYTAERCMESVSRTDLKNADQVPWVFPKKNFDLYKSATQHTHKTKLPAWLKRTLFFMLFLFFGAAYAISQTSFFNPESKSEPQPIRTAQTDNLPPIEVLLDDPYPEGVSACIKVSNFCRCYDNSNRLLEINMSECLNLLYSPVLPKAPSRTHRGATRDTVRSTGA